MKKLTTTFAALIFVLFLSGFGCSNSEEEGDFDGTDSGDSAADSGNSAADSGDSAADSGDSGADSGNSGADSGDSAADSGDSAADSGDSAADSGDSAADSGDSAADSGDSAADSGADSGDFGSDTGDSGVLEFCGDGIKNGSEFCDDGENNGKYDHCKSDCSGLGDFCGDGIKNGPEFCDDGEFNGKYGHCNADCLGVCGDGIKSGSEFCDDGENNGKYDHCKFDCSAQRRETNNICSKTGGTPCIDSKTKLTWSAKSSDSMNWEEAGTYCNSLQEGDFDDWRLPTISELRTLILNCAGTISGGNCRVTDDCLSYPDCRDASCDCESDGGGVYSFFGDTDWLWSSSPNTNFENSYWIVDFNYANVRDNGKTNESRVRCAR